MDLCVISIENQFLASFSLDPALYYATPRHNLIYNNHTQHFSVAVVEWSYAITWSQKNSYSYYFAIYWR